MSANDMRPHSVQINAGVWCNILAQKAGSVCMCVHMWVCVCIVFSLHMGGIGLFIYTYIVTRLVFSSTCGFLVYLDNVELKPFCYHTYVTLSLSLSLVSHTKY